MFVTWLTEEESNEDVVIKELPPPPAPPSKFEADAAVLKGLRLAGLTS